MREMTGKNYSVWSRTARRNFPAAAARRRLKTRPAGKHHLAIPCALRRLAIASLHQVVTCVPAPCLLRVNTKEDLTMRCPEALRADAPAAGGSTMWNE